MAAINSAPPSKEAIAAHQREFSLYSQALSEVGGKGLRMPSLPCAQAARRRPFGVAMAIGADLVFRGGSAGPHP